MGHAGLATRVDAVGNLIGRLPATGRDASVSTASEPNSPEQERALLIGSHIDTVVNAGRYDGVLGVLMGLAITELARDESAPLPLSIDVIAFCEEEGIRYQSPYIGSRALVGDLLPGDPLLERLDDQGVRLADALTDFGCHPAELATAAYNPAKVAAFIEPHIEQGPVLEADGIPVGVVSGAAGQTRASFRFTGEMGHAGTVPMALRRDPLPAAARFVSEVQQAAIRRPGTLATVGRLDVFPNVANVIPSEVAVRIDLRHVDNSQREACFVGLHRQAMQIAEASGVECRLEWCEQQAATRCDAPCRTILREAIAEEGHSVHELVSGAGHDAVIMASRFPTSLLFIRCAGGLSHHPDESVTEEDVTVGLRVLWRAVQKIAARESANLPPVASC